MTATDSVSIRRPANLRRIPIPVLVLAGLLVCGLLDVALVAFIVVGPPAGKTTSFFLELVLLVGGLIVTGAGVLFYPARARAAIPYIFLVLAWHTGLQISLSDQRPVVITAFDVLVPIVLFLALVARWDADPRVSLLTQRYWRLLGIFAIFSAWGVCLALLRDVNTGAFLMNFKAFTIYPVITLIMLWCIQSWRQLYATTAVFLALVLERAFLGVIGHSGTQNNTILSTGQIAGRSNGDFAAVNHYAFYIMSGMLLVAVLVVASRSPRLRLFLLAPLLLLIFGLIATLSRGAFVSSAIGLVVLALFLTRRRAVALLAVVLLTFAAVQILHPGSATLVSARLHTFDNSTQARLDYLSLGEAVILHYPLGAGWGAAFDQTPAGLVESHNPDTDWPWYHDDYIQLATEVGLPGLIAFLWTWFWVVRAGIRAYRGARESPHAPIVLGLLIAVLAMLADAFTDQFFWRSDIAPHIWIVGGLLLAAISLMGRPSPDAEPVPVE